MDFIFNFLDRVTGPETELVELLPLAVLLAISVGIHYLRSLILKLFVEIGELKTLIGVKQMIDDLRRQKGQGNGQQ